MSMLERRVFAGSAACGMSIVRHCLVSRARRRARVAKTAAIWAGRRPRCADRGRATPRSEEHTSELQSLMRISYAVFCLKQKNRHTTHTTDAQQPPLGNIVTTH